MIAASSCYIITIFKIMLFDFFHFIADNYLTYNGLKKGFHISLPKEPYVIPSTSCYYVLCHAYAHLYHSKITLREEESLVLFMQ